MDKELREAIEGILTDEDIEYQYILDEGFGEDKATTAFRDLRVRTIDDILALIHTYGNRDTSKVDRLEVIDDTGRAYVKGSIYGSPVKVELQLQDDNRTLKLFVEETDNN